MNRLLRSNWWPVIAYLTVFVWLVFTNIGNLFPDLKPSLSIDHYKFLSQLDSTAHLATALALSSILVQVSSRRWTLGILLVLIFTWEVFEFVTQPILAGEPVTERIEYYSDLLDDIALGIAGTLIGAYAQPLNTDNQ